MSATSWTSAPNTDGTAVPVGLIGDPCARQFAYASQNAQFDFIDSWVNGNDPRGYLPFPDGTETTGYPDGAGVGWTKKGVNLIILNSVARPLKLVQTQTALDTHGNSIDIQMCYPHGSPEDMSRIHEIPAGRSRPNSRLHLTDGKPSMLAGLGWYRFDTKGGDLWRALSFQLGDDTTQHVGMVVHLDFRDRGFQRNSATYAFGAVTADLEREHGSLDKFFHMKMPNPHNTPWGPTQCSKSASDRGGLTVWCSPFPHGPDQLGTNSVVVWVLDGSSTVG